MAVKPTQMRSRRKSSPSALWIVVGVVVLAAASGAWYLLRPVPPDVVAKRFLDAQLKGDTKTAVTFVSGGGQRFMDQSPLSALGNRAPEYTVGAATVQGDRATVNVSLATPELAQVGGKGQLDLPCALVKEQRAWKIDLMESSRPQMNALMQAMPSVPGLGTGTPSPGRR